MAFRTQPLQIPVEYTGTRKASKKLDELAKKGKKTVKGLKNIGKTGVGVFSSLVSSTNPLTVAMGALAAATAKATIEFAKLEQYQVQFEVLTGSIERGNAILQETIQLAKFTPFSQESSIVGVKRLLAYDIALKDVVEDLRVLGDIASGVGMEKLPNLILAFGQVNSATKLTGMELRQFKEAGVGLTQMLSKLYKVSVPRVLDMISKGEVKFQDVREAIKSATEEGGRFHGMMEKVSKTQKGRWSTIMDQLQIMWQGLGESIKPVNDKLLTFLEVITGAQDKEPPFLQTLNFYTKKIEEFKKKIKNDPDVLFAGSTGDSNLKKLRLYTRLLQGLIERENKRQAQKRQFIEEDRLAEEERIRREKEQKRIAEENRLSKIQIPTIDTDSKGQTKAELLKESLEADKQHLNERIDMQKAYTAHMIDLNNTLTNAGIDNSFSDAQIFADTVNQKIKWAKEFTDKYTSFGFDMMTAADGQSRALFNIGKAAAIAHAVMNTAQGITYSLATGNFFQAGVIGAMGALQIAKIASTKYNSGQTSGTAPRVSFGGFQSPSTQANPASGLREFSFNDTFLTEIKGVRHDVQNLTNETVKNREFDDVRN